MVGVGVGGVCAKGAAEEQKANSTGDGYHETAQIFEGYGCVGWVWWVWVVGVGGVCAKGAAETQQEMDTMRQVIPAENEMSPLK